MRPMLNTMGQVFFALAGSLLIGLAPHSAFSESIQTQYNISHNNGLGHFATSSALACSSSFQSGLNAGSDCLLGQIVNRLLVDSASQWANARGKQLFGEYFSLSNRFAYSADGFSGELDAVIPVMAFSGGSTSNAGAFFLQSGVTRYTDRQGLPRNDLRYGAVRRFNLSRQPDVNVLGISTFFQQNVEYGHGRVTLGMDYGGAWGRGAFNYFLPTTEWLQSLTRQDLEERALEGMELSLHLAPTNTVSVETALTRWEAFDGFGRKSIGARLGLQWRPHDWLNIGTARDGIGTVDARSSVHLAFEIPLGRRHATPRWRGLGLTEDKQSGHATNIWRPVESIGQIRVAERAITSEMRAQRLLRNFDLKFLQDSASSGTAIRVQVTLEAPVPTPTRLHLRLKPGQGDNPAVAGEDFVDEAVELVLAEGAVRGEVTIELLRNGNMSEPRSLGVVLSMVGASASHLDY